MQEELDHMMEAGVVRESQSPHVSEVRMVPKKDGALRFCIDYRRLNEITIRDQHPIPRITDLIYQVGRSSYFVALDLRSGYWQIAMEPGSVPPSLQRRPLRIHRHALRADKRARHIPTCDAGVLGVAGRAGILVYLDDGLIHAATFEECFARCREVFRLLKAAGLTINLKKCMFSPHEILYLGQLIGHGHRRPNPRKIEALKGWRPPRTVTELRSLLGLCSYFRSYIPGFAELMLPVTELTRGLPKQGARKGSKLPVRWTEDCAARVQQALEIASKAILQIPDEYGE